MKVVIIFISGLVTGAFIMEKYRDEILSISESLNTIEGEIDNAVGKNTSESQPETTLGV